MEHFMQIWNFFPSAFQLILNVKNIFRILSFMRPKKWKYSNNDLNPSSESYWKGTWCNAIAG